MYSMHTFLLPTQSVALSLKPIALKDKNLQSKQQQTTKILLNSQVLSFCNKLQTLIKQ